MRSAKYRIDIGVPNGESIHVPSDRSYPHWLQQLLQSYERLGYTVERQAHEHGAWHVIDGLSTFHKIEVHIV